MRHVRIGPTLAALAIAAALISAAGPVGAADEITDEDLQWERLSRHARAGMSLSMAADTVNYYFIKRPDTLGRNPGRAVMVMTRFEYLANELMRNNAMNRSTKVKLYEARNNVREAAGLAADLSVNDAIMSLRSLGKLMDLQGLEADEQLQALKSEWSEVDLPYLQVALENNKIFDVDDSATELASADFAATLRAQLQNLSGLTTDQLIAGLGQALQSGAIDLAGAAEAVAGAIASGISVNLDSVAQGGGFGSFADAVSAYNAQYGTNYTADQARQALGQ